MKLLLTLVCTLCFTTVFAAEVDTDCAATNESRLVVNKDVKTKVVAPTKGTSRQ